MVHLSRNTWFLLYIALGVHLSTFRICLENILCKSKLNAWILVTAKVTGLFTGEVSMVFGLEILQYTKALCQGHYNYLERLSDPLLLRIISYLELEDVGQLGRTSCRFRQVSSRDARTEVQAYVRFHHSTFCLLSWVGIHHYKSSVIKYK